MIWKTACLPASSAGSYSSGNVTSIIALLALPGADEPGVELRQQAGGAELDEEVLRLAALERLAVDPALEVDQQRIAGRGGSLDRRQAREPLAQPLELRLDRLVGHLGLGAADLEPAVLAELGRRPHEDLDRERQLLAVAGELVEVDLRVADRVDPGLEQRPLVPLRERVAERLLDDGLAADPLDHHLRRNLALAEAGHLHLAGERLGGAVDALCDEVGLDRDVDLDLGLGEFGDGRLHRGQLTRRYLSGGWSWDGPRSAAGAAAGSCTSASRSTTRGSSG